MTDRFLESLSSYATSLKFEDLPREVVHEAKRRIVDTLGCAIGAYSERTCEIARLHALEVTSKPGSTVLGTRHRSSPELATFANGVMARYLDFNDNGGGKHVKQRGHPSDNIPAVVAVAEYAGAHAKVLLSGVVLAYEVQGRLGELASLGARKLDHVYYETLASCSAASHVLGLSSEATTQALALAAVPNVALRETRNGPLSMWKGCAGANATRNGVFAALLARRGLTGPARAFEGDFGVVNVVTGPMELPSFAGRESTYKISEAKLKYFPAENSTQSAIHAAIELRKEIRSIEDIQAIVIETFDQAVDFTADAADKWHPTTRETADHSLPYVTAAALMDGTVSIQHFAEERIRDAALAELMQKIDVRRNAAYTKEHPEAQHTRMELVTKSGDRYWKEIRYAKGHPNNPMTDEDIKQKFHGLAEPFLKHRQITEILDRLWKMESEQNVSEILSLFEIE